MEGLLRIAEVQKEKTQNKINKTADEIDLKIDELTRLRTRQSSLKMDMHYIDQAIASCKRNRAMMDEENTVTDGCEKGPEKTISAGEGSRPH